MPFDSNLKKTKVSLSRHFWHYQRCKFSNSWLRKATWLSSGTETACLLMVKQKANLALQGAAGWQPKGPRKVTAHSWPLRERDQRLLLLQVFSPSKLRLQIATLILPLFHPHVMSSFTSHICRLSPQSKHIYHKCCVVSHVQEQEIQKDLTMSATTAPISSPPPFPPPPPCYHHMKREGI